MRTIVVDLKEKERNIIGKYKLKDALFQKFLQWYNAPDCENAFKGNLVLQGL